MTNEEIDRRIANAVLDERSGTAAPFWGLFRVVYRSAYEAGLEEAAQIAADHSENSLVGCGEGGCGGTIAQEIRALKDSPAPSLSTVS